MNDFKSEPIAIRNAMLNAAKRVIESGWYVLGNEVERFEKEWAEACGVKFGVGVANGMDAIEIALRGLDIGAGDEVITTPMTAFATVLAIIRAGATPVLADIDPRTALLSLESVQRCLTNRTKAVVLVHLYGQLRDMEVWHDLCKENNIYLIEDCAQAHLAKYNGNHAGSFGEAGAYSFYPTKNLGAPGDAGMLITNSAKLAESASMLRNYGQSVRYHHPILGMNSRLDELHAAMLSERLKWLDDFTSRRQKIGEMFNEKINNSRLEKLAPPQQDSSHVYHLYVLLSEKRDELIKHLMRAGIQSLIHYPIPVHYQDPCKDLRRDPKGLDASEFHSRNCLSIPCHPQLSDNDVNLIIESVNDF